MGKGVGRRRGEIEKKEKELMFKDNSVLIVGVKRCGKGYGRVNGDGEKIK